MDQKHLDMIARGVTVGLCLGVAGFLTLLATIAFLGPRIAPLMNKLPW
ncbi:MAG: hypothetical protein WBB48_04055 [Thermodesulfobacteriota bacterium]|jgi:hypothetical protein